jgi:hypothetical protein|tara:strand:- start:183 stop:389 length:207 start_codon:yes stop_codon:yes gene_type:complete
MRHAKYEKPVRKLFAGYYIVNHSSGACTVTLNSDSLWDVKEECTGELFATERTKKRAMNFIIDQFEMA